MEDKKDICANCIYYNPVFSNVGECRFNAPYIRKEQRHKMGVHCNETELIEEVCRTEFTHISVDGWCGQFRQRDTAAKSKMGTKKALKKKNVEKKLNDLFNDLRHNAYFVDYHAYYYKEANQIIRKHFEALVEND